MFFHGILPQSAYRTDNCILLKNVLGDWRSFRVNHHFLLFYFISQRYFAADNFSPAHLVLMDKPDSFAGAVGFVLGHRQHDVDFQPPGCCRGVIVLLNRLPTNMILFQNLLYLVVFGDVAEPSV